jgi:nitroreductase
MNVDQAIQSKHAVRQFKAQPLTKEEVLAILNAGRRSQSSKNSQPWHFIAIQDKNTLAELSKCGNFAGHILGAALGVAIITPPPEQRFSIMFDAGQSAAYMQLAAVELGIGSCLATIYDPDKARELLGYPQDLELHITLSFGYPLDPMAVNRPPQRQGRRSLDEVVHWDKW